MLENLIEGVLFFPLSLPLLFFFFLGDQGGPGCRRTTTNGRRATEDLLAVDEDFSFSLFRFTADQGQRK